MAIGYPCPCCGFMTLIEEQPGSFDICAVCFWEDDNVQFHDPDYRGGANKVSLNEARRNFLEYGAISKEFITRVRKPLDDEIPVSPDIELWRSLRESHLSGDEGKLNDLVEQFLSDGVDRISLMKQALNGKERSTGIFLLRYLELPDLQRLFLDLIFLASFSHGALQEIRDAALSIPKEWVLERIELAAEPYLAKGTHDEYRRLLELYELLDRNLTIKLANRAILRRDKDIMEAGYDFLNKLKSNQQ
jgi:hypothetical protein